jgi:poly-gamma-glutamate system protein
MMWRPGRASKGVLILVATVTLVGYGLVEMFPKKTGKRHYMDKIRAANIMSRGMEIIKRHRVSIFGRINTEYDLSGSGMIGSGLTPITSKHGVLGAKQTAANPNFAAVMVDLYKKAKLKKGDVIAIGFSGSFPAMNLATLAAAEALELKPIIISSSSASRWGANDPELTWLDMERILFENEVITSRSKAASMGGEQDMGIGLPPEGVRMIRAAIKRNGVELIDPPDLVSSFDLRMTIYDEQAAGEPIACYVNVGGGAGSVGSVLVKRMFPPGLSRSLSQADRLRDSILTRMSRKDIPVINMYNIKKLAKRYGLPESPTRLPPVGEGGVYAALGYNMILVWAVSISLLVILFLLLRMDLRHYVLRIRNALGLQNQGQDL